MPNLARSLAVSLAIVSFGCAGYAQDPEPQANPNPKSLVQQLNARAAEGGIVVGESINGLARIGEWKYVEYWLANGVSPINDQQKLAQIASEITAPVMLKIRTYPELTPQSLAVLNKLAAAQKAALESPAFLKQAVQDLNGSTDSRLSASRTILHGGNPAIKILVESAIQDPPPARINDLISLGTALGPGAANALTQLTIYGVGDARKNALAALAKANPPDVILDLVMALHASDATEAERSIAAAAIQRINGSLPTREESLALLQKNLTNKRIKAARFKNTNQRETLWSVNDKRDGVVFQLARSLQVAYRDVADAAARMRRFGDLPDHWVGVALSADVGYRIMIDPDWGDPAQVDAVRNQYGQYATGPALSASLKTALENRDMPGIVGLARLIDGRLVPGANAALVTENSPKLSPLVQATLHDDVRVRYEAATAIARQRQSRPYPGKSYVDRCLREMSKLESRPVAILVETRGEVILEQEKILKALGYDVKVVQTVAALEREVARGHELELILSKTELYDHPAVELIDRVRRTKLGATVPILFYGPAVSGIHTLRWQGVSKLIDRPKTAYAYTELLLNIQNARRLPELTSLDRQLYRETAVEFLALDGTK